MHSPSTAAKNLLLLLLPPRMAGFWLLASAVGGVGCFGGQTGTELAPDTRDGKSPTEVGGTGTSRGDDGSDEDVDVATPAADTNPCDETEAAVQQFVSDTGVSAELVSEFATRVNPFALTTTEGSVLGATFELSPKSGSCVTSIAQGKVLLLPMNIVLRSADGAVQVTLASTVTAFPKLEGGVARLEIEGSAECNANTCLTQWVDTTGYVSLRPSLSARLEAFGEGVQILGKMTVLGRSIAQCVASECPTQWQTVAEVLLSQLQ